MTHPRRWGIDHRGVSWVHSKPLVRKGQGDGNCRLVWGGNSGTSRHQPLLPRPPTSCFSPTPFPGGSAPLEVGQAVVPRCPTGGVHRLLPHLVEQPNQQDVGWAWDEALGGRSEFGFQ